jgi:hypothetical protein
MRAVFERRPELDQPLEGERAERFEQVSRAHDVGLDRREPRHAIDGPMGTRGEMEHEARRDRAREALASAIRLRFLSSHSQASSDRST